MRKIIEIARKLKEAWEWWYLLSAILYLIPGVPVVWGVIQGLPADVIALYVMAAIAYSLVLVNEMPAVRSALLGRVAPQLGPGISPKTELRRLLGWLRTEIQSNGYRGTRRRYLDSVMDYITALRLDDDYPDLMRALLDLSAAYSEGDRRNAHAKLRAFGPMPYYETQCRRALDEITLALSPAEGYDQNTGSIPSSYIS